MPSIVFHSHEQFRDMVVKALELADDPQDVQVVSGGRYPGLSVPDALADKLMPAAADDHPADGDSLSETVTDITEPVSEPVPVSEPETVDLTGVVPPKRNQSTEVWAEFMRGLNIDVDGLDRDAMVDKFDQLAQGSA